MDGPVLRSAADLTGQEGAVIRVSGTYGVQSLGGHAIKVAAPDGSWVRLTKVAYVELDGGVVELSQRPEGEMLALEGKQVVAVGTLVRPADAPGGGVVAEPSVGPTLVDLQSIEPV